MLKPFNGIPTSPSASEVVQKHYVSCSPGPHGEPLTKYCQRIIKCSMNQDFGSEMSTNRRKTLFIFFFYLSTEFMCFLHQSIDVVKVSKTRLLSTTIPFIAIALSLENFIIAHIVNAFCYRSSLPEALA